MAAPPLGLPPLAPSAAKPVSSAPAAAPDRVSAAASEFETMLLSAMLAPMFETLETDGPFGGGSAEESWRGLLVEQYARSITEAGGIGIADSIRRELLSIQEGEGA